MGSPSATTTISGEQLPPPDPTFGGVIEEKASESKAWWPPTVVPPKGAPNILLIMTDDEGFGAPSTFGGVIETPALDRLAKNGLRYTQFHSTSLCSPTRAALITGRNHHVEGFGVVGEAATGFPGYDSVIRKDAGTIGTILKENGYATAWFGKDHNTPFYQSSQAGPFNQWPIGMGFDYFYGFVGGDASQWQPNLFRNTTAIYPFQGNPGWNLTTAMADDAIQYMKQLKEIAPDKPFFVYYVPGGTHAPQMLGNRAIYHAGWVAATTPVNLPWELNTATPPDVITGYRWELYNINEDVTEANDLADKMPDKLKELQDVFYAEAKKYDVLPLDAV